MDDRQQLRRALVQHLESLQRAGVQDLPRIPWTSCERSETPDVQVHPPAVSADGQHRADAPSASQTVAHPVAHVSHLSTASAAAPRSPAPPPEAPASMPSSSPRRTAALPSPAAPDGPGCPMLADRQQALELLQQEVVACTACPALVRNRKQTVFGVGNPRPRLCFIGEAPGADEDREGLPFVGRAGQLLDKIIEACTLRRDDVYILNTVKCRPPDNRTPTEEEVENCRDFFERQFQILRPEFICCLGATAAKALLRSTLPLGRLRGRFHEFQGAQVIVTYHPAYLLRNPAAKKDTWDDMKLLLQAMGITLPKA